ncbi:MAG: TolC family protein [Balneolaceae bacterium]
MRAYIRNSIPAILIAALLATATQAPGQSSAAEHPDEITMTVDEAVQIALIHHYMLQRGVLDLDMAEAQIREAWGAVYPQVSASGSYTRNIQSPNPFAGSDAGGLFDLFGSLEWLAYNERARTDGDPSTDPLDFDEFFDRQQQGMEAAGANMQGGDNPFAVDNQFEMGLSITQSIYNRAAFAAIEGARHLRKMSADQLDSERQSVADQIRHSFYGALLARKQVEVMESSVERLRRTVEETRAAVEAGLLSSYNRLSAEVELVNLETSLIEVENRAELALKNLSFQLGVPVSTTLHLRGELEFRESLIPELPDMDTLHNLAMSRRPDLQQADGYLELLEVNHRVTGASYFPSVSAFANAAYIGQVPDNRVVVSPVQGQDFTYSTSNRGFFHNSYWYPALAVGVRFQWNLFNGFQTASRVQQNRIEVRQAEIDRRNLREGMRLEVEQAVRDLETSLSRIRSQERNIEQAETNYEQARRRLQEGVGTPLEERQASSLLDQSRLNYLSAVHDFLTAVSRFDKVTGKPVMATD